MTDSPRQVVSGGFLRESISSQPARRPARRVHAQSPAPLKHCKTAPRSVAGSALAAATAALGAATLAAKAPWST